MIIARKNQVLAGDSRHATNTGGLFGEQIVSLDVINIPSKSAPTDAFVY